MSFAIELGAGFLKIWQKSHLVTESSQWLFNLVNLSQRKAALQS
jgi:hypothetical protein